MSIPTRCPSCKSDYTLADNLAGKTVRCKNCGGAIAVRAAKGRADVEEVEEVEPHGDGRQRERIQTKTNAAQRPQARANEEAASRLRRRDRDDEDFRRSPQRSNRGLVIGLIIAGVGLVVLVGGGIFVVVLLSSRKSANNAPAAFFEADAPPANADAVTRALFQLKSPEMHIRHEGLRKLKDMIPDERRPEVIKALEPLLNDPEFFTRHWAIEALGVWGNQDAVPILLRAMNDKETRGDAMKALGRLKDARAAEPIAARLGEFFDRHDAEEALKAMGPIAEKAVLARLNHHEWGVRISVCDILAAIGTKQSLPALEKVAAAGKDIRSGQNHIVGMKAQEAITAIKARQ